MIAYAAICAAFWLLVIGCTLGACRLIDYAATCAGRSRAYRLGRQR